MSDDEVGTSQFLTLTSFNNIRHINRCCLFSIYYIFSIYYLSSVQRLDGWLDDTHPSVFSAVETKWGETMLNRDQWATSTPDRWDSEPVNFDGGRVRAWLGVQSPAPPERKTSCSKAVQTDGEVRVSEFTFSHSVETFFCINQFMYIK